MSNLINQLLGQINPEALNEISGKFGLNEEQTKDILSNLISSVSAGTSDADSPTQAAGLANMLGGGADKILDDISAKLNIDKQTITGVVSSVAPMLMGVLQKQGIDPSALNTNNLSSLLDQNGDGKVSLGDAAGLLGKIGSKEGSNNVLSGLIDSVLKGKN